MLFLKGMLHTTLRDAYKITRGSNHCYEVLLQRGKQRLSYSGIVLIGLMWLIMVVSLFVTVAKVLDWLDYLYIISYIKLSITPIKYIPQVN